MSDESDRQVLLLIADISGYTKFMLANRTSVKHGQIIISELMKTIIHEVEIPLEISKLEGDAIFMYAVKDPANPGQWEHTRRAVAARILKFFDIFAAKVHHLAESSICQCGSCANIRTLRIKFVVHSGEAHFYTLGKFEELSGPDVILIHRLLKNSVRSNEYVLLTDAARQDLPFDPKIEFDRGVEKYEEEFGGVVTWTFIPASVAVAPNPEKPVAAKAPARRIQVTKAPWQTAPVTFGKVSLMDKLKDEWIKVIGGMLMGFGRRKPAPFRNLPS